MKNDPPYNFGISQEDALSELKALELDQSDTLLCIASGGEIPLNILALRKVRIVACDTSIEQIYLSKLKLTCILYLEQNDAAKLIGLTKSTAKERRELYTKIENKLSNEEKEFWRNNPDAIESGIVNVARFEKYILKFSWVLRTLLGKRKLMRLLELKSIKEQQSYFDQQISNWWIKLMFKIAFHPKIYKNRGMDEHGLKHQKDNSIANFFYNRFRDFCTATLTSKNYYFQYTFFNEILSEEAYPEYLSPEGIARIRENHELLSFVHMDFSNCLRSKPKGTFNKFHLSNIGDWLTTDQMEDVYKSMNELGASNSKYVLRYIHRNHNIPHSVSTNFELNKAKGHQLEKTDRYPFYNIIPGKLN